MAESPPDASRKQQSSRRAQKLSEERLARKRELDRQAQRSARVKTKNHIAQLESRIETLTEVQGTGDIKSLIDQIEDQRKENEALKATLKTIGKLVGTTGENGTVLQTKTEIEDEKATLPVHHSPDTDDTQDHIEPRNNEHMDMSGTSTTTDLIHANNGVRMGYGNRDHLSNSYSQISIHDCRTEEEPFFGSGHTKLGDFTWTVPSAESLLHAASLFGQSEWQGSVAQCCSKTIMLSNELLAQCSKLQLQNSSNQEARDADIAVRAILHGWNAVTERYALDPVWQTLRHADTAMFRKCASPTERFVCMRVVLLKLRHQVNPTEENLDALPYFLHERPSQRCIQHPPLIDYLVWPGLRERFVFNPHTYCCDKFSMMFWPCFRFAWNCEFRDAYICNHQTGLYHLSASFLECSRDLHYYRMSPDFFNEYPELKADIQCAVTQPEASSPAFAGGSTGFDMAPPPGLESLRNGYVGGEGFSQMQWPVDQPNMRVGEV